MYISITDIYSYVQAKVVGGGISERKTRPLEEGEQLYLAGHVGNSSFEGQTFKARCITSKIAADPHKIEILFNNYSDYKQWKCICSCKAGAGEKCKHIVASLLYVYNLKEGSSVSCTDVEQSWGKRKRAELGEVTSVDEFCHVKPASFIPQISQSIVVPFLYQCLEAVPECEAAIHFNERNKTKLEVRLYRTISIIGTIKPLQLCKNAYTILLFFFSFSVACFSCFRHEDVIRTVPEYIKSILSNIEASLFFEKLRINTDGLKDCCKKKLAQFEDDDILEGMLCEQGSATWKSIRKNRITGTSCYSLYTYNKNEWDKKCERFFYPKKYDTKQMKYGIEQEPQAIIAFQSHNSHYEVKHVGLLICRKYPWLSYSPDGILYENSEVSKLLEIKCPYEGKSKSVDEVLPTLPYLNEDFTLKKKHIYYGQIQFGMALLNLKVCEFVIYFSKKNVLEPL